MRGDSIKETIAAGASQRYFAYTAKTASGKYDPLWYGTPISSQDVELSDDVFIISKERIEEYLRQQRQGTEGGTGEETGGGLGTIKPGLTTTSGAANVAETPEIRYPQGRPPIDPGVSGETAFPPSNGAPQGDELIGSATPGEPLSKRIVSWTGEIPPQRWTQLYTKALSRFSVDKAVRMKLTVSIQIEGEIPEYREYEFRAAIKELGLED